MAEAPVAARPQPEPLLCTESPIVVVGKPSRRDIHKSQPVPCADSQICCRGRKPSSSARKIYPPDPPKKVPVTKGIKKPSVELSQRLVYRLGLSRQFGQKQKTAELAAVTAQSAVFVMDKRAWQAKKEGREMMYAAKIRMMVGCEDSHNLVDVDEIYLEGRDSLGFFKKEVLYHHLKDNPGTIKVKIAPYPDLLPAISPRDERYVRSTLNINCPDSLLSLPRE